MKRGEREEPEQTKLPNLLSPSYSRSGITERLVICLHVLHVADELLQEGFSAEPFLQGQVHSQGLQDGPIVAQGVGVGQLRAQLRKLAEKPSVSAKLPGTLPGLPGDSRDTQRSPECSVTFLTSWTSE